jgi:hypothetical protein
LKLFNLELICTENIAHFKTIAMSDAASVSTAAISQWIAQKLDVQEIRENLKALGWDEYMVDAHLKEFKKVKYAKKQFRGFICLATGAFLGFVS